MPLRRKRMRDRRPREQKRKPSAGERQPLTRKDLAGGFTITAAILFDLAALQVNIPLGTFAAAATCAAAALILSQE